MNRRSQRDCWCPTSTWCTTRSRNFAAKISRRFGVSRRNARNRPGRYVPVSSSSRRARRCSSSRRSKTSALCVPRLQRRHSRCARYRLSSVNSGWLGQPPRGGKSSIRGRRSPCSASHRPHPQGVVLVVVVDVAVVEVRVPGVVRVVLIGGTRPIVVRRHARKRRRNPPTSPASASRATGTTGGRSPPEGYDRLPAHACQRPAGEAGRTHHGETGSPEPALAGPAQASIPRPLTDLGDEGLHPPPCGAAIRRFAAQAPRPARPHTATPACSGSRPTQVRTLAGVRFSTRRPFALSSRHDNPGRRTAATIRESSSTVAACVAWADDWSVNGSGGCVGSRSGRG